LKVSKVPPLANVGKMAHLVIFGVSTRKSMRAIGARF
jgi:hypothetical protein